MKYPAIVTFGEDGMYTIGFRNLSDRCMVKAATMDEAISKARKQIIIELKDYFDHKQHPPAPSNKYSYETLISLPLSTSIKILLLSAILSSGISKVELAKRMNIQPQQVGRLTNLHYTSKLSTMESAFTALGISLNISLTSL